MSWTLCTSGAAIAKAGASASSTITGSGATLAEWSDEVEGTICTQTRYDWVTNYASVGAKFKPILADLASDMIATRIVAYDMSGFAQLAEAQTLLNVLENHLSRNLAALKREQIKEKM